MFSSQFPSNTQIPSNSEAVLKITPTEDKRKGVGEQQLPDISPATKAAFGVL